MNREKILEGDVVRLKSGGPQMTVRKSDENYEFECLFWAEVNGIFVRETFFLHELTKESTEDIYPDIDNT